jgi:SAM-dependent methyltransferase
MAHLAQKIFFENVKNQYPEFFLNKKVIDCGSLNVNGSLKSMFIDSEYLGVDIVAGDNVHMVAKTHELPYKEEFDVVVSGEMLEHDEFWKESMHKMYEMLKSGGLIAVSAAGEGRPEHGTLRTGNIWGTSDDYYKNVTVDMVKEAFEGLEFSFFDVKHSGTDIYFFGIKK